MSEQTKRIPHPSASIPKPISYFPEKSVTFRSIKKSSFMNILWNQSTIDLTDRELTIIKPYFPNPIPNSGQLVDWVKVVCDWMLEIIKRSNDIKGF